jgi:hypothetical protein
MLLFIKNQLNVLTWRYTFSCLYCTFPTSSSLLRTIHRVTYRIREYEGVTKIFRTDAVKIINLTTKRVWKLPTSIQLHATWHTDSLNMVVLSCTGASRYHNCCIDGGTSPEYFGYTLVYNCTIVLKHTFVYTHSLATTCDDQVLSCY